MKLLGGWGQWLGLEGEGAISSAERQGAGWGRTTGNRPGPHHLHVARLKGQR